MSNIEEKQQCQLCKKSYPDTTFPPCDGNELCQFCYDRISKMESQITTLTKELDDTKNELQARIIEVELLKEEKKQLESQINKEKYDYYSKLEVDNSNLLDTCARLESEKKQLEEELAKTLADYHLFSEDMMEVQQQLEAKDNIIARLEERIIEYTTEQNNIYLKIEYYKKQLEQEKQYKEDAILKIGEITEKLEQYKTLVSEIEKLAYKDSENGMRVKLRQILQKYKEKK